MADRVIFDAIKASLAGELTDQKIRAMAGIKGDGAIRGGLREQIAGASTQRVYDAIVSAFIAAVTAGGLRLEGVGVIKPAGNRIKEVSWRYDGYDCVLGEPEEWEYQRVRRDFGPPGWYCYFNNFPSGGSITRESLLGLGWVPAGLNGGVGVSVKYGPIDDAPGYLGRWRRVPWPGGPGGFSVMSCDLENRIMQKKPGDKKDQVWVVVNPETGLDDWVTVGYGYTQGRGVRFISDQRYF